MRHGRHEADFSHSLTDLMSGVAVMFLVIASIFMVQASKAKQAALEAKNNAEQESAKNEVLAEKYNDLDQRDQQGIEALEHLKSELESTQSVQVDYDKRKDPRLLTITFKPERLNFQTGDCEVNDVMLAGLRDTLREIFPTVCATVGGGGAGLQKSIALEGHTDNLSLVSGRCPGISPATACFRDKSSSECKKQGFENNVRLSAARAQYVFFQARDVLADDETVARCLDSNFMVSGRGPMEPSQGGRWDAPASLKQNATNRRVVIKVRVMAATP